MLDVCQCYPESTEAAEIVGRQCACVYATAVVTAKVHRSQRKDDSADMFDSKDLGGTIQL